MVEVVRALGTGLDCELVPHPARRPLVLAAVAHLARLRLRVRLRSRVRVRSRSRSRVGVRVRSSAPR